MKQAVILTELTDEQFAHLEEAAAGGYELVRTLEDVTDPDKVEVIVGWDAEINQVLEKDNWPNLHWVHVLSAGIDNLPLALLKERHITLTAANGVASHSIPESVFGALLAHTRGIFTAYDRQRVQYWNKPFQLTEIRGKTMMIMGVGSIGQQMARVAKAFEMNVIGVNRSGKKVDNTDVQYVQSEAFDHVDEADIVVNILPLTPETKSIYNKDFFKKMKKEGIFINVGRGPSVVEADLLDALQTGEIDYAILDVFNTEPLPKDSPFWYQNNVLVLNHQTFALEDYYKATFKVFTDNVSEVVKHGKPTINVKNFETGY